MSAFCQLKLQDDLKYMQDNFISQLEKTGEKSYRPFRSSPRRKLFTFKLSYSHHSWCQIIQIVDETNISLKCC